MKNLMLLISAFLFATVLMGVDGCSKKEEAPEATTMEESNIVEGEDEATPEAMEEEAGTAEEQSMESEESSDEGSEEEDTANEE